MSFKDFFYEQKTNIRANELKRGNTVKNINPECAHFKSEGEVVKVASMPVIKTKKVKNGKNTPGNLVTYKITNNGKNFEPGDVVTKTEIQLSKT